MGKQIPLYGKNGKGKFTTVSDEDYDELNKRRWFLNHKGYVVRNRLKIDVNNNCISMHRSIMNNISNKEIIDHIDGDKTNNQRENLRICNKTQNSQNRRKNKNIESNYKGLRWDKNHNVWQVRIQADLQNINGGNFKDEYLAALRYDQLARIYHKEFAQLNFPNISDYKYVDKYIEDNKPTSEYIGVSWSTRYKHWRAFITVEHKQIFLGNFDNEIKAAQAVDIGLYNNRHKRQRQIHYNFPELIKS